MSTSVQIDPCPERMYGGVGRCKCSFWFAVAHDVLGVLIMMVGAFGGLPIHDLFVYAGAIVIFFSLIWWVFWYSGNIDVAPEELEDDVGMTKPKSQRGLGRVVRRLSSSIRNSLRRSRRATSTTQPPSTDVALSTICYNSSSSGGGGGGGGACSHKGLVRETLSI